MKYKKGKIIIILLFFPDGVQDFHITFSLIFEILAFTFLLTEMFLSYYNGRRKITIKKIYVDP